MNNPPAVHPPDRRNVGGWLLLLSAAGIPSSLLWDFSWESTVGIDRVWAPAHVATYLSVTVAGLVAFGLIFGNQRAKDADRYGVRIGQWEAPAGVWVVAWGACAFAFAMIFDRWWQSGYGLAAGIWHPPQIIKACAFFAILFGVMIFFRDRGFPFIFAGGMLLVMMGVASITLTYPNRQHGAAFYQLACGLYPLVLALLAVAGRPRFSAALGGVVSLAAMCLAVCLLPLIPAHPEVAPIYNRLDHLMPPPFPLLMVAPALAMDALLRWYPGRDQRFQFWRQAGESGLAFFVVFIAVQWPFAQLLLTSAADNSFFAGGGVHWPFFLKIDARSRVAFWKISGDELTIPRGLAAAGLAILSARIGLTLGAWIKRLHR